MTARRSDKVPLPRLWTLFAVAWLLVLALVAWRLPMAGLTRAHLGGSVACLALLGLAYLWLTVRQAPAWRISSPECTPHGRQRRLSAHSA
jgi:hypothetical protein